ncbi:MAG: 1,4-alpha-glucan branching protein GlgB [Planctomycetaceae bacterium]|nr:1,4-alpha-glucan branching protein GlgB [Planctomycetaceae bacterium]
MSNTFDQPADRSTLYRYMGAHPVEGGVRFAVWAPNAQEVSVISDGNGWTHSRDWLTGSDSGVWSGVFAGVNPGTRYKFAIRARDGRIIEKADPFAFYSEVRPDTASIVWSLRDFEWHDESWIAQRDKTNWLDQPVSVYEVHPGSWRRPTDGRVFHNYREIARMLADYVKEVGYTHIQLMPVTEHPFDGSWGYQTTGYFAASSRFGTPHDFQYFVDHMHRNGIGVLLDWVPGHFPTDGHGLGCFDGTHLYEHEDPRKGFHPDWNTLIFNYGRREVSEFLLSSARFWCDVFHIDGLRVDAVASMLYLDYSRDSDQWVPNQYGGRENLEAIDFLRDFNTVLHQEFPGILTVAEESTAWPGVSRPVYTGGLGFTMKWDMGWMNDTLRFMQRDPVHRSWHLNDLTFRGVYAFSENFMLPLSHDEVVHGKKALLDQMPGDEWQKFANLRLLFGMQFANSGKKLQFMGAEIGQWTEWNHDAEVDWALREFETHEGVRRLICDLNRLYKSEKALYLTDHLSDGFRWIVGDDTTNCVLAFVRQTEDESEQLVVVANLTPTPRHDYRIGVPQAGYFKELINTDGEWYGGSGVGNQGGVDSTADSSHGYDQSVELQLPPLSVVVLKREPERPAAERKVSVTGVRTGGSKSPAPEPHSPGATDGSA